MRNLLVDLCIEAEGHTCTAMFMAKAADDYYSTSLSLDHNGSYSSSSSSSSSEGDQRRELFRVGVSVSKYFVTKRLPGFIYECMEVLGRWMDGWMGVKPLVHTIIYHNYNCTWHPVTVGGNGYVEDFPMARLYRQSPLNAIWEGSSNVIALDILRAHRSLPVLMEVMRRAKGNHMPFDVYVDRLDGMGKQPLMHWHSIINLQHPCHLSSPSADQGSPLRH